MENNYVCPKCRSFLNTDEYLILTAETDLDEGLVLLSPELGNYKISHNGFFNFEEGTKVKFLCPVCHKNLSSRLNDNLAHLKLIDENKKEYDIYFSRVAGEQSTYKVSGESMDIYGKDKDKYVDYMNLADMF